MKNGLITLCLCLLFGTTALPAQNLIVKRTPSQYDSLITAWSEMKNDLYFERMTDDYIALDTSRHFQAISTLPQEEYIKRLNNIVTPVRLPYNDIIQKHIVAYTTTYRNHTNQVIGLSQYYFPMIEQELAISDLPLELKYISVIESALQPSAKSYAGAAGLWQFMLATGRQYGLEVTSMVDERLDPIKSTKAACMLLKDLYRIYDDWALVMAAYNYGQGSVSKALQRAGNADTLTYWDIYPYLPKQTRDYVPSFVGMTYVYHYYKDYGIKPVPTIIPLATDTVTIDRNLHFEQIASTMDTPIELLRMLNPQFIKDIVPGNTKPYSLVLPQKDIAKFIACQGEIFAKDTIYIDSRYVTATPTGSVAVAKSTTNYTVKSGDTLGAIAKKYSVTIAKLKSWNGLRSDNLRIGQKLRIGG